MRKNSKKVKQQTEQKDNLIKEEQVKKTIQEAKAKKEQADLNEDPSEPEDLFDDMTI